MAIFPARYFCSRALLLPRYERVSRLTCPACVSVASPPLFGAPALFEIAVKECRFSAPRRSIADMMVSNGGHQSAQSSFLYLYSNALLTCNAAKSKS